MRNQLNDKNHLRAQLIKYNTVSLNNLIHNSNNKNINNNKGNRKIETKKQDKSFKAINPKDTINIGIFVPSELKERFDEAYYHFINSSFSDNIFNKFGDSEKICTRDYLPLSMFIDKIELGSYLVYQVKGNVNLVVHVNLNNLDKNPIIIINNYIKDKTGNFNIYHVRK